MAPAHRRGFYVSLQYSGQGIATLVAGLIGVVLAWVMSDSAFTVWGWRIAMAIGALIVPVGLILRRSLPETLHADVQAQAAPPFASYSRTAFFAFVTLLSATILTYVLNYMTTYAQTVLHLGSGIAFGASITVGAGIMVGAVIGGLLSDRYGRKPVMIWPMLIGTLAIIPGFMLVTRYPAAWSLYLVAGSVRFFTGIAVSVALAVVTEALPPRVRSGALAIVYAFTISIFGGSTQFVIAWLTDVTGNPIAPAWYMFAGSAIGLVAMAMVRETAPVKTGEV